MTANLPETLDGLVLNTADQAESLLASLRHLDAFVENQFRGGDGSHRWRGEYGHRREDQELTADRPEPATEVRGHTREDVEQMVQCVWRAIGLVEGACQSLETAKQLRARCQDEE